VLYCRVDEGTRVPLYSHSRLSAYEKCPQQYQFRYIDKIKRDTQSIEGFMGNRVHEALESLYRDRLRSKIPSREDLVALYHASWKAEYSEKIVIVKTEFTADHYRKIGEDCITKYYDRYHPFDDGETLGLEEKIELSLDERGQYQIRGYIDRLVRREPGVYEIQDFKTSGGWLPTDTELRKDRQLALYQMAVEKRYPDARDIRLVWHYLAADRRLTSSRTADELAQHRRQTIGLIEKIEATREFPARAGILCRWCEYQDICDAGKAYLGVETPEARRPARSLDKAVQIGLFGD
jgi:putative RecB family exonuclease